MIHLILFVKKGTGGHEKILFLGEKLFYFRISKIPPIPIIINKVFYILEFDIFLGLIKSKSDYIVIIYVLLLEQNNQV